MMSLFDVAMEPRALFDTEHPIHTSNDAAKYSSYNAAHRAAFTRSFTGALLNPGRNALLGLHRKRNSKSRNGKRCRKDGPADHDLFLIIIGIWRCLIGEPRASAHRTTSLRG